MRTHSLDGRFTQILVGPRGQADVDTEVVTETVTFMKLEGRYAKRDYPLQLEVRVGYEGTVELIITDANGATYCEAAMLFDGANLQVSANNGITPMEVKPLIVLVRNCEEDSSPAATVQSYR